jgi:hypothetical protein
VKHLANSAFLIIVLVEQLGFGVESSSDHFGLQSMLG